MCQYHAPPRPCGPWPSASESRPSVCRLLSSFQSRAVCREFEDGLPKRNAVFGKSAARLLSVTAKAMCSFKRLGWDASDIQAHAAERRHTVQPARSSCPNRRRETPPVTTPGPAPSTNISALDIDFTFISSGGRQRSCKALPVFSRPPRLPRLDRRRGSRAPGRWCGCELLKQQHQRSLLETLSPILTFPSLTVPADGDGTSIVAFSDSSVISESSGLYDIAGLNQHVDNRHGATIEVADIGVLTSRIAHRASALRRFLVFFASLRATGLRAGFSSLLARPAQRAWGTNAISPRSWLR